MRFRRCGLSSSSQSHHSGHRLRTTTTSCPGGYHHFLKPLVTSVERPGSGAVGARPTRRTTTSQHARRRLQPVVSWLLPSTTAHHEFRGEPAWLAARRYFERQHVSALSVRLENRSAVNERRAIVRSRPGPCPTKSPRPVKDQLIATVA